MPALDATIEECRALVIDDNPTSRSIVAAQLRELGVGTVVQSPRVQDARRVLEHQRFDIVLCEQRFHGSSYSGQDLIDDLRRAQLLPLDTVFIMLTNEASYTKVAEAAESALDGYLLKPHTALALAERLHQARHRKRELSDIFSAIEAGDLALAASRCRERFESRAAYWLYAARIGAELLLRLGDGAGARTLFEAVVGAKAVPWARLGIARAQIDQGQAQPARRTLEALLAAEPSYADAWDVLGRAQLEQGHFAEALATFRQAGEITPGSLMRQQKLGMLAFWLGDHDTATRALERAVLMGSQSKMLDAQSLVLLALLRFDRRDGKGLQRCTDNLAHLRERMQAGRESAAATSPRLERFADVMEVLLALYERRSAEALVQVRALAAGATAPGFDLEAAGNWLALLARLSSQELQLEDAAAWVDATALRFCTARSVTEMLGHAVSAHAPYAEAVRAAGVKITALAEQAVSHTLAGRPEQAARLLLTEGERHGNGKLIELARLTLERHRERIPDAAALTERWRTLRERWPAAAGVPQLGQAGARSSGALVLRTDAARPPGPVAAQTPTTTTSPTTVPAQANAAAPSPAGLPVAPTTATPA